jgi:predicted Zn-dependent protease
MRKTLILLVIFSCSIGIASAQINDVMDALARMDSVIAAYNEEFTPQETYFLGRTVAAHILDKYPLYTEKPAVTNYLNFICNALAINSGIPGWYNGYHAAVIDSNIPNAFSTPGGHIFLSLALIELAATEDMLAAIIAHELAHIQLKHGIADIRHTRLIQDLEQEKNRISNTMAADDQLQRFSDSVNEIVQTLFSRGYSQLQEFEADSFALSLLSSAGYNPASYLELLKILEKLRINQTGGLNESHPLPAQRIARVERELLAYNKRDNSSVRQERFLSIMRR